MSEVTTGAAGSDAGDTKPTLKPIPDRTAADKPRNAAGEFTKADGTQRGASDGDDDAELRRRRNDPDDPLYDSTAEGEDPDHDYPIATLPGMVSEEKDAAQPKVSKPLKGAARLLDAARKAKGKGAPAATDDLIEPGSAEAQAQVAKPKEGDAATKVVTPAAPVDPNAPPPPDPNAPPKYKVKARDENGQPVFEEFESEEKFHENWRTIRGMYRSEMTKRTTAERIASDNFKSAEDWMRLAKGYESGKIPLPGRGAANDGNGNGAAHPPSTGDEVRGAGQLPPDTTTAPEDEVVAGIDWTEYRRIKREAVAKYRQEDGEAVAQAYIARETARILDARHKREREVESAPQRERDEILEHGNKLHNLVESMREATYADGTPLYPEFADAEALKEIGAIAWQEAKDGIPWEKLTTNKGLHKLVLLWRDWRRITNRPWNGASTVTTTATPPPSGAAPTPAERDGVSEAVGAIAAHNAGVVVGGSAPVRRASGGSPADEFRRRLLKADEVSPLGYSR